MLQKSKTFFEGKKKFRKGDQHKHDKCTNFDVYGKPISLTFQGNDKFKTRIGATMTFLVFFLLLSFGMFRAQSFLRNELKNNVQIVVHERNLAQQGIEES